MKKNSLIRSLGLILALVMLVCAAPSPAVFASEEEVDPIFQTAPRLKAASVYADEALTEKIDDLSTLRAGVRYYYTLECEPGEALKSVALIAKEIDSRLRIGSHLYRYCYANFYEPEQFIKTCVCEIIEDFSTKINYCRKNFTVNYR